MRPLFLICPCLQIKMIFIKRADRFCITLFYLRFGSGYENFGFSFGFANVSAFLHIKVQYKSFFLYEYLSFYEIKKKESLQETRTLNRLFSFKCTFYHITITYKFISCTSFIFILQRGQDILFNELSEKEDTAYRYYQETFYILRLRLRCQE